MTDSLKFGPEWLRNLQAGDGCTGGAGSLTTPRYQLAEHRYGREEMLALFDHTVKAPEPLCNLSGLYVSKTQLPLALIQMTEDEQRLWNGGVSASIGRGRGGSVDRGGRTRTGRTGSHFRISFEDEGPRIETQQFSVRTRAFDRPPTDRAWSERNGAIDSADWNGSTSPRKELNRGVSGSSLMESNWRRQRIGEDEDGWRTNARTEKWDMLPSKGSWREDDKHRGERMETDEDKRGERWDHKGGNRAFDAHPPMLRRNRSNHHDHDNLPEWAVENPSESGGSFDASGAFHGVYSDDDDDFADGRLHERRRGSRVRRVSEGNTPHSKISPSLKLTMSRPISIKSERPLNGERPKSLHSETRSDLSERESRRSLSPIRSPPPSDIVIKKVQAPIGRGTASTTEVKKKGQTKQDKSQKDPSSSGQAPTSKVKSKSVSAKKTDDTKAEKLKTERNKASNKPEEFVQVETQKERPPSIAHPKLPSIQRQVEHNIATRVATSVIDSQVDEKHKIMEPDNLNMEEEVAKLVDHQDEGPLHSSSSILNQSALESTGEVQVNSGEEKWYYRDPQGEVQGPFSASEMAEWLKQGYFHFNLLVRRTCDDRYTTLGSLMTLCGGSPFQPGTTFPPLKKISDNFISPGIAVSSVPTNLPINSALQKPAMDESALAYQYHQYRLIQQNQQFLVKQCRTNAINKLSQSEQWSSLNPIEQNQLIVQYMRQTNPEISVNNIIQPSPPSQPSVVPPSAFLPSMAQTAQPSSSVLQLFPQLHQQVAKTPVNSHMPANSQQVASAPQMSNQPIDPIQQLMQQISLQNMPTMSQAAMAPSPPQPQPQPPQEDDNPIKSWLRQLGVTTNEPLPGSQQLPPPPHLQPQSPIDSVWHPQPPPHLSTFNAQTWMSQVGPIQPTIPPGQVAGSLWDVHPKEMKTEQQILEEQNLKMQEEKKKNEQRKKEEMERQQQAEQEQRMQRLQEEELARLKAAEEAAKREEAERKKREEEKRRREEELRRQEEEQRKVEEKRRKEEERRREEKRKYDEEMNRKKQEEEKRRREELKRQEEKLRKEEEKRKKIEEEQRRQEEERLRKEEEARKKVEAEEQAKKAELRRREVEALRKLQERNKAPWAQVPPALPQTTQTSLAEIQRLEREKKAEELRFQQVMQQQQQLAQQKLDAQEAALTDSAKRLQFKWAEKAAPGNNVNQVKNLAQIQQEEQERIAKVKQQERERQEREKASQKESAVPVQNVSIWGTASQSLNWSNSGSSSISGFWEDPAAAKVNTAAVVKTNAAAAGKQAQVKHYSVTATVVKAAQIQQQQYQQQQQNSKAGKNKNEKEKEVVKQIFERNTAKTDDFTQWCTKILTNLQVEVDIPTFISFLYDIEAAYEVKEYVRMYLGDGKQCAEFAKQFIEKRSKCRSAQRPQSHADDLNKPAPAINPNSSTEFQEVKSKSKKPKKGKMFKVDSKMLGFNVMSAPDRINVGDRDYADEV